MRCKYTKQQIIETIKHWKNVLKTMNESSNELLIELSKKYGNDIVMSDRRSFNITNDDAQYLFSVLNKYMFNNKLSACEIYCSSYKNIVSKLKQIRSNIPANNFYGMFNVIVDDEKLHSINDDLVYLSKLIIINTSLINNSNFVFACSSLCHEMIHLYGTLYGQESICNKYWLLYKINVDVHTSPVFINMKRRANDMGLSIINDFGGLNFSELNSEAFQNMINHAVNDGVNLDESNAVSACYSEDNTRISSRISRGKTSILHVDYLN